MTAKRELTMDEVAAIGTTVGPSIRESVRAELVGKLDAIEARVRKVERKQSYLAGALAVLIVVAPIVWDQVKPKPAPAEQPRSATCNSSND